jgi:hypothetical protein
VHDVTQHDVGYFGQLTSGRVSAFIYVAIVDLRKGLKMRSVNPREMSWKKSSYSAANGDCVQVAQLAGDRIGVRDSKSTSDLFVSFTPAEWRAFVGQVKRDGLIAGE